MSLAAFYQRCEQDAFPPSVVLHDEGNYLLVRISGHFLPRSGRIGPGCTGVQQPQEVVYFRDGAHGGPRVVPRGLLFYGNHGAETADAFDFRLPENADKLFRVCRKRVHVPPLAFGIYRVERQ